jgi:hypothetical protein
MSSLPRGSVGEFGSMMDSRYASFESHIPASDETPDKRDTFERPDNGVEARGKNLREEREKPA